MEKSLAIFKTSSCPAFIHVVRVFAWGHFSCAPFSQLRKHHIVTKRKRQKFLYHFTPQSLRCNILERKLRGLHPYPPYAKSFFHLSHSPCTWILMLAINAPCYAVNAWRHWCSIDALLCYRRKYVAARLAALNIGYYVYKLTSAHVPHAMPECKLLI